MYILPRISTAYNTRTSNYYLPRRMLIAELGFKILIGKIMNGYKIWKVRVLKEDLIDSQ